MYDARKLVKTVLKAAGLKLSRINNIGPPPLVYHKIDVLFDVGANVGQYAMRARESGYRAKIVSFEPLPDAHSRLLANSKADENWVVHSRCAVGSAPGETEINISKNLVSSSVLPMLNSHLNAYPNSAYIGKSRTDIITIDSVFDLYCKNSDRVFLKIDTQGYESKVLAGVSDNLHKVHAVQIELSLLPLYDGQQTYEHFVSFFQKNGFYTWFIEPGGVDSKTGQMLYFDAVFVRDA